MLSRVVRQHDTDFRWKALKRASLAAQTSFSVCPLVVLLPRVSSTKTAAGLDSTFSPPVGKSGALLLFDLRRAAAACISSSSEGDDLVVVVSPAAAAAGVTVRRKRKAFIITRSKRSTKRMQTIYYTNNRAQSSTLLFEVDAFNSV